MQLLWFRVMYSIRFGLLILVSYFICYLNFTSLSWFVAYGNSNYFINLFCPNKCFITYTYIQNVFIILEVAMIWVRLFLSVGIHITDCYKTVAFIRYQTISNLLFKQKQETKQKSYVQVISICIVYCRFQKRCPDHYRSRKNLKGQLDMSNPMSDLTC